MHTKDLLQIQLRPFWISRKNFYQLLYDLFVEPSEVILIGIQNQVKFQELGKIHEGGEILRQFFEHFSPDQLSCEIQEYQRLFVGPGPVAAPPWESYYRSNERLLFEEWNFQVRDFYHQFGIQNVKEKNEPDDHLLLELEFMTYLSDLCLEEKEDERILYFLSKQIEFLEKHLTIWSPHFCERVIENTTSSLYLGAAMLLADFLTFDLASMLEMKEAILL